MWSWLAFKHCTEKSSLHYPKLSTTSNLNGLSLFYLQTNHTENLQDYALNIYRQIYHFIMCKHNCFCVQNWTIKLNLSDFKLSIAVFQKWLVLYARNNACWLIKVLTLKQYEVDLKMLSRKVLKMQKISPTPYFPLPCSLSLEKAALSAMDNHIWGVIAFN